MHCKEVSNEYLVDTEKLYDQQAFLGICINRGRKFGTLWSTPVASVHVRPPRQLLIRAGLGRRGTGLI
jgi:hypothetical protein